MAPFFGLRGKALNYAVLMIAGCDFLLFGYGKCARYRSLSWCIVWWVVVW